MADQGRTGYRFRSPLRLLPQPAAVVVGNGTADILGARPYPAFLNPAAAEVLPYTIFSIVPLCERFSGRNACSLPSISDAGQSREAGSLGTLRGGCTKKCVGIEGISAGAEVDEATLRLQRKAACKPENLQAAF